MSPESPGGHIVQNSITVSTTVQSKDGQHQIYKGKNIKWLKVVVALAGDICEISVMKLESFVMSA